ncbi:hypothetical protein K3495_g11590 [Podosphaera aphanis]|nr:hypothetical protein K3495_g11590 [Podosphaera aphanis]
MSVIAAQTPIQLPNNEPISLKFCHSLQFRDVIEDQEELQDSKKRRKGSELPDLAKVLGIWTDAQKITRDGYQALREILATLEDSNMRSIPNSLKIIQERCRDELPLLPLFSSTISSSASNQPTGKQSGSSSEGASIRAGLPDAARAIDGDVIFPSDFVEYSTPLGNQIGQILWVSRDQRLESLTFNEIVLRVAPVTHASNLCDYAMYKNHDFPDDGIGQNQYIIEEECFIILASYAVRRRSEFYIEWPVQRASATRHNLGVKISWIYSKEEGVRTVLESDPIRGELEVQQFGRECLATLVGQNTISSPIFVFADDFGLNPKRHHSITGVSFMSAGLRFEEREKGPSSYSLVLGPH